MGIRKEKRKKISVSLTIVGGADLSAREPSIASQPSGQSITVFFSPLSNKHRNSSTKRFEGSKTKKQNIKKERKDE